jgi:hypothetical protein
MAPAMNLMDIVPIHTRGVHPDQDLALTRHRDRALTGHKAPMTVLVLANLTNPHAIGHV